MDLIKNILFFVVLTAILCAIVLFEIRSERRRFFEPAPSSPRLHQSYDYVAVALAGAAQGSQQPLSISAA